GDLIDRYHDTKLILDLMMKLKDQAHSHNSDVYMVMGNHELLNLSGEYDYTTYTDIMSFGGIENREKEFSLKGNYGHFLRRELNTTVVVGDTIFVHAGYGDLIDRYHDTKLILDLMMKLKDQAHSHNSDVYMVMGNHELLNLSGEYDYTTYTDIMSFGGIENREKEFSLKGNYGHFLRRELNTTVVVGDTIFVHAGLLPEHLNDISWVELNEYVHEILETTPPDMSKIIMSERFGERIYTDDLLNQYGPLLTYDLVLGPEKVICNVHVLYYF
ncbi:hypothetical protein PIROE2DRAFT_10261, partial [Piromyces sp. E2]